VITKGRLTHAVRAFKDFFCMKYIGAVVPIPYISNNERTPNVTKKHGAKDREMEGSVYNTSIDPQIQREKLPYRAGQVYIIDLYAKISKKTRKDGVFYVRERKKKKKNLSRARRRHQTNLKA
jgi:hypothetical protein